MAAVAKAQGFRTFTTIPNGKNGWTVVNYELCGLMRFIVYTHLKWKSYIHLSQHLGITWKNTAEVQFGTWNIMKYCGCNPSGNQTWPLKLPWDFPWLFPCSILSELRWILSIVHGQSLEPRVSPWTEMPRSESKGSLKTKKTWRDWTSLWLSCFKSMKSSNAHECIQKYSKFGFKSDFFGGKSSNRWMVYRNSLRHCN